MLTGVFCTFSKGQTLCVSVLSAWEEWEAGWLAIF